MIQVEHAQSDAMRAPPPLTAASPPGATSPVDHWRPYARQFSADPRRSDDELLKRLLLEISPGDTVINVGAGGGRLALPIALHGSHVTAVEPSPAMGEVLLSVAQEHHVNNISLVRSEWQEATVDPADQTLCVHVLYTIQDIGGFVTMLEDHARKQVMVVLYGAPPQSQNYPLWRKVHGTSSITTSVQGGMWGDAAWARRLAWEDGWPWPIALHGSHVTAVEPSPAMGEVLRSIGC